jgi:hypothetical protein
MQATNYRIVRRFINKRRNEVIDLYMEAKRREEQLLHEAKVRRLLKAARCEPARIAKPRLPLLTWLALYLPGPNTRLETGVK